MTSPTDSPSVALFLPSLAGGGAERVFVQLANRFARMGVPTHLVLSDAVGPYLPEVDDMVHVVDLEAGGVGRSLGKLVAYLRRAQPKALLSGLESANVVAVIAARLARRSTTSAIAIRALPSAAHANVANLRARCLRWVCRFVLPFADRIIANSNGVADDASAFLGIDRERFDVIYNPLEAEQIATLSKEVPDHRWFDDGEPPVVLAIGRLDALKDFASLLRAFSLLVRRRHCRLIILGEGDERQALEALARQLGLTDDQFALPGFTPNPFGWIRRARVVVSSSISEGFPNVILQALACGTPVVSTRSAGGASEILEDGKWGELTPIGDTQRLADALDRSIQCGPIRDLTERAREFDPATVAEQYLQILLPNRVNCAVE